MVELLTFATALRSNEHVAHGTVALASNAIETTARRSSHEFLDEECQTSVLPTFLCR